MTTEEKLKEMLGDYYEMGVPGSPNAAILQNILGADNELRDPQSENEALLKLIYEDVIGAVYDARDEAQAAAEQAGTAAEAVANKAPAITDTASGAIASFPDGADGMPVKSLVVNVEPNQDLHGYDNPWPAGGGKNLCDMYGKSGSSFVSKNLSLKAGTYTTSASGISGNYATYVREAATEGDPSGTIIDQKVNSGNFTFTLAADTNLMIQWYAPNDSSADLTGHTFQCEAGSSATTYAPYENLCPITGWTGATVTRCGGNLIDDNIKYQYSTTVVVVGANDYGFNIFMKAGQYTLSASFLNGVHYGAFVREQNDTANRRIWNSDSTTTAGTFTLSNDGLYRFWFYNIDGATASNIEWCKLEPGSTATAYEPYAGTTKSISFPSTIYGGTDEVVSGSGAADYEYMVLTGEENWQKTNAGAYYIALSGYDESDAVTCECSHFKPQANVRAAAEVNDVSCCFLRGDNNKRFYIRFDNKATTPDFVAYLQGQYANGTPVQVVYKIASPSVFSTTPVTDLVTQYGQNNIFADCGPVDVEYRADTKLYIKRLTGPTDDDMTADANIAAGTYFMVGNNLFLSTASIAAGEAIVPGTNCTATNLAAALNALQ